MAIFIIHKTGRAAENSAELGSYSLSLSLFKNRQSGSKERPLESDDCLTLLQYTRRQFRNIQYLLQ